MPARLLCLYGQGSPGPWDVVRGVEPLAELVVLVSDDRRSRQAREIFDALDVAVFDDADAARDAVGDFDGVVTYSEPQVVATARLAQRWGLPGLSPTAARTLRSKALQRQRLHETGCDRIAFRPAATAADVSAAARELGLPVVVKPDGGWGSRDVHRVSSEAQLAGVLRAVAQDERGGYVVERLLQGRDEAPFGDYVSVEVVMAGGEPLVCSVTGKLPLLPPFREPGQFWPSQLGAAEKTRMCEFVLDAVRALGVELGALHVEVKLCEDGPHIIELNGRLGGFIPELIESATGIDLVALAAAAALGVAPRSAVLDERGPVEHSGVRFQNSCLLPAGAVEFVGAPTAAALARRPDVDFYRVLFSPGERFTPGVDTREVDLVQGVAADHHAMIELVAELQREIVLEFHGAGGELWSLRGDRIAESNLAFRDGRDDAGARN